MLSKRVIPCLDVRDGKTTKGIKFKNNVNIGDPVEMARFYYEQGADEIVFYDITASSDRRDIMINVVRRVECQHSSGPGSQDHRRRGQGFRQPVHCPRDGCQKGGGI